MKTPYALLLLALPSFAAISGRAFGATQDAPGLARCTVNGAAIENPEQLRNLLVDDGGTRTIAVALGEKADGGTYLTFAHLNVGYDRFGGKDTLTLNVTDTTGNIVGLKRDAARPLWARVTFPSRVKGPSPTLELNCEPVPAAYALEPSWSYNVDPIYGVSYLATTIPAFAAVDYSIYPAKSPGEFLAENYCVAGSASVAAAEMKSQPSLWRKDALDHKTVLAPESVSVNLDGSIEWKQRVQTVDCVKSHVEKQWNSDTGEQEDVTVCDELRETELDPLTVRIPACDR